MPGAEDGTKALAKRYGWRGPTAIQVGAWDATYTGTASFSVMSPLSSVSNPIRPFDVAIPNATITSVILRGNSGDVGTTLSFDSCYAYTYATS